MPDQRIDGFLLTAHHRPLIEAALIVGTFEQTQTTP
jgi:hypothetical protein